MSKGGRFHVTLFRSIVFVAFLVIVFTMIYGTSDIVTSMKTGNFSHFNVYSKSLSRGVINKRTLILMSDEGTKEEIITNKNNTSLSVLSRRFPVCIIIGAKKYGTGALTTHLNMHPKIACDPSEPQFFNNRSGHYDMGLEWYRERMKLSKHGQITIEKSPGYFIDLEAPKRISEFNKTIKLILMVREPVTRTISDYAHARAKHERMGNKEPFPLFEMLAINQTTGKVNQDWMQIISSRFSEHFEHWRDYFSRNQIHIVDGDKYITDPVPELRKIEDFLGIEHWFKSEHFRFDPQKGFMCMVKRNATKCMQKSKGRKHPNVDSQIIKKLKNYFIPYNRRFYELIGHNFEWERFISM